MITRFSTLIIGLFFFSIGYAQDMQKGYTYLETGQYNDAYQFFDSILITYPTNKTARLCFGRAVGLKGDANKAKSIFQNLMDDFPSDFEVKLNLAESLLWNKEYKEAKTFYKTLLNENDSSFEANLGFASSLFHNKEFESALLYIDKALLLKNNNPNALISKKYIHLELANVFMKKERYKEALQLLNSNLFYHKNDYVTLMKIAELGIVSNQLNLSKKSYESMMNNTIDSLKGMNGLALIYHLKNRDRKALKISSSALKMSTTCSDSTIQQLITKRYIETLIWNGKYKKASKLIEELLTKNSNKKWLFLLRANLNLYKEDSKQSILDFNRVLLIDSTSFDANLGKANALKANGNYSEAYKAAYKTLSFYVDQKDAVNFINKLNIKFSPSIKNNSAYSIDIGKNNSLSNQSLLTFPISTKLSFLGDFNYRKTDNLNLANQASSNKILGGLTYQLKPKTYLTLKLGVSNAATANKKFNNFSSEFSLKLSPFIKQSLEIGSTRKLEDFNSDLIGRGIMQNHFFINYNLNTNFKLGWFTQYYFTIQSDNNNRNLIFTSLYYNVLKKPLLKIGVNYQNIRFKNQLPTIYFSPNRFYAIETFIDLIKDKNIAQNNSIFYGLTGATGYQFIEENSSQLTYRLNASLGFKFNDRSLINIYGSHSNIASTTTAGFTITEVGFRFIFHFTKRPVFTL